MNKERAIHSDFGTKIKYLRKSKDYSLKDLEDLTGISRSYINRIENGLRECPSYPIIEKIAQALGVEPLYLLGKSSNMEDRSIVMLDQLLLSNNITIDGVNVFSIKEIDMLLNLIRLVHEVSWKSETIIEDIYEITLAVNKIKKELDL